MTRVKQEITEEKPVEAKVSEPKVEVKESNPIKGVDKETKKPYTRTRKRKPGFASKGKFDIPEELKPDGWTLRWVLNKKSRIAELENQDWIIYRNAALNKELTNKNGDVITMFGSVDLVEKEQNLILMAKPSEWFDDDKAEKQRLNNEVEQSIRGGSLNTVDSSYVPKGQKDVISK